MKQNLLLHNLARYQTCFYVSVVYTLASYRHVTSAVTCGKRYESFTDRHFACEVPLQLVDDTGGGGNTLVTCARACQDMDLCSSFTFTERSQGWSCAFCPAENITALAFTPNDNRTETWIRRSGRVITPVHGQLADIPGAGEPGRLIVVKGTASTPLHHKRFMDLFNKQRGTIVLRFVRFASFIRLNSKLSGRSWSSDTERDFPVELFPFAEGEPYEINLLTTSGGFAVYVNGVYIMTYDLSISKAKTIDSMRLKFGAELHYVSF
ncbi:galectin [Elysia marginata]|uniref:Galectin n=1 Tax=Elysia marginata TaxID=1093978 RepID=A0AAV4J0J2_9GAST|nr:galectin [Elysia marginata]